MNTSASHNPSLHRAFTLVEMLVVITVISLLLALTGVGLGNSISEMQLSATARELNGTFNYAALLARKENRPIQVRFYKYSTPESSTASFRSYQLLALKGIDGGQPEVESLSEVYNLPSGVMMSPSVQYNTLAGLPEAEQGPKDPDIGHTYTYVTFEIRPNGLTTLPKETPPVITLLLEAQYKSATDLPPNYRSVVMNPVNARARVY